MLSSVDKGMEDLIFNTELQGLGIKAMLRSALPSEKNVKKARIRETKLWHTTRAEAG